MRVASGGGYGDPLEREAQLVLADIRAEIISLAAARDVYGVVVDAATGTIDVAATESLRGTLWQKRLHDA